MVLIYVEEDLFQKNDVIDFGDSIGFFCITRK